MFNMQLRQHTSSNRRVRLFALLTSLYLFIGTAMAAEQTVKATASTVNVQEELPLHRYSWQFDTLAGGAPLRVDGLADQLILRFGNRADQVAENARLQLRYIYSPTLVRDSSQLRIRLNGEVIAAFKLDADKAGEQHQQTLELPARYIARYNEISMELLAEATSFECSVVSPAAWLEFSADSTLELNQRQLVLADDLSWFPEPFFYATDFGQATVRYLLAEDADQQVVQAAGILASYFGKIADWRGVDHQVFRFSKQWQTELATVNPQNEQDIFARLDTQEAASWPQEHAVVFVTNKEKPWSLRDLPDVTEPTVRLLTNPRNHIYKMLVVQAPERVGLVQAIQGLVEHPVGLSGPYATIHQTAVAPREAYAAPRWLSTKRPVAFSELVEYEADLQRTGYRNAPISINFRLPPDLFVWQRKGIPIDLKFRYTPPLDKDESRLRVSVNNEFIKGYGLTAEGVGGFSERLRVPLLEVNPFAPPVLSIPSFKLGAANRLDFQYSFSAQMQECKIRPLGNTLGAIDGDSSIDLRGYENYTQMPNLQLFAKTGYPFSRYDDLSNTLLVMAEQPSNNEIKAAFKALEIIAASTGHHASLLQLSSVEQVAPNASQDILLVGGAVLQQWFNRFGRVGLDKQLSFHGLAGETQLLYQAKDAVSVSGPSAALLSFQSPLAAAATVVALTANQDEFLVQVDHLLGSTQRSSEIEGFMTVLTPGKAQHLASPEHYYVGKLSFWKRIHYHLANYPVLVAIITLLALVTLVLVLYWLLAGIARRRLQH